MDPMKFATDMQALAMAMVVWSVFVTIFWMVVGWRAMRAHEQIADAAADATVEVARRDRPAPRDS